MAQTKSSFDAMLELYSTMYNLNPEEKKFLSDTALNKDKDTEFTISDTAAHNFDAIGTAFYKIIDKHQSFFKIDINDIEKNKTKLIHLTEATKYDGLPVGTFFPKTLYEDIYKFLTDGTVPEYSHYAWGLSIEINNFMVRWANFKEKTSTMPGYTAYSKINLDQLRKFDEIDSSYSPLTLEKEIYKNDADNFFTRFTKRFTKHKLDESTTDPGFETLFEFDLTAQLIIKYRNVSFKEKDNSLKNPVFASRSDELFQLYMRNKCKEKQRNIILTPIDQDQDQDERTVMEFLKEEMQKDKSCTLTRVKGGSTTRKVAKTSSKPKKAVSDSKAKSKPSNVAKKPAAAKKSEATKKPATAKKPAAAKKPATVKKPKTAAKKPAAAAKKSTTKK